MMKTLLLLFLTTCLFVSQAHSHGTPIRIDVIGNHLAVSHPGNEDFAPPIMGQDEENDDFLVITSLPSLGNVILWDKPGIEIYGMEDARSLSIEVLARPVIESSPAEERALWYWNPATENVEPSPSEFHLLGTDMRFSTILPNQSTSASFLLADSVAGQTGSHNHNLLNYALEYEQVDNESSPPGIYAFFARFTSTAPASLNPLEPSDPFLLVFNYATVSDSMIPASEAIFAAGTLAGDYDLDGDVDGRDFLVWQSTFSSTTRTVSDASLNGIVDSADLQIWQQHYGETSGSSTLPKPHNVPEPTGISLLLGTLILLASQERKRLEPLQ